MAKSKIKKENPCPCAESTVARIMPVSDGSFRKTLSCALYPIRTEISLGSAPTAFNFTSVPSINDKDMARMWYRLVPLGTVERSGGTGNEHWMLVRRVFAKITISKYKPDSIFLSEDG